MVLEEEEQKPFSPGTPPSSSFTLQTQNSQTYLPSLELKANVGDLGPEISTLPLNSIPVEESPSGSAIVLCTGIPRRGWSKQKTMNRDKKLQTLSLHFNPIPFPPKNRPLEMASHKDLLVRVGLWDFLNLDFQQNLRVDLIKELVVCYNSKSPYYVYVPGVRISLTRAALAAALSLPSEKFRDEAFVFSQDETSLLKEVIWGWLVLKDEDEELKEDCKLKVGLYMKDMNWISLILLMMKRELSKGINLVNCYYAPHWQLLLKKQRPDLFYDQVPEVGSIEKGKDTGELEIGSCIKISKDTDEGKENILVMCRKRKMEYEKLAKERKLFTGKNVMSDSEEDKSRKPHMKDETVDQTCASEENVQVTLNTFQGCCRSDNLEKRKDEEVLDLEVLCKRKDAMDEQEKEAECEASDEVHEVIDQDKANEAAFEANTTSILKEALHNPEDQDQHQLELQFKNASEKERVGLADDRGDEMDYQEVVLKDMADNTGEEVETLAATDLIMPADANEELKKDGSTVLVFRGIDGSDRHYVHCDDMMEDKANEVAPEVNVGVSLEVQHEKDDYVMEDKANEAAFDANTTSILKEALHNQEEASEEQENEAECEANIGVSHEEDEMIEDKAYVGNSVDVYCEQKDGMVEEKEHCQKVDNVIEDKAIEAESETLVGNSMHHMMEDKANEVASEVNVAVSLEVQQEKDNYVMEDEPNEAAFVANTTSILKEALHNPEDATNEQENEAECEANIGVSHEIHSEGEDEVSEDKAFVGNSVDVYCQQKDGMVEEKEQKGDKAIEAESEARAGNSIDDMMGNKANEGVSEVNVGVSLEVQQEKDDYVMEDKANEAAFEANTRIIFKEALHNQEVGHSLVVHQPFMSNSNAAVEKLFLPVHGEVLQNKDINEVSVEHFAAETGVNNYPNPMNGEIYCLDDDEDQYEHGTETEKTGNGREYVHGSDLDLCARQVDVWMARLKNAAREKAQANHDINQMLLKKVEEQGQMIQNYEKKVEAQSRIIQNYEILRQAEQQQRQKDVRKCERELHFMQSCLEDYRKALKHVHVSFAKYREGFRVPDHSLYMDHPDGGGRVILVAEWEKKEQLRRQNAIKAMMQNFEKELMGEWECHLDRFDSFCDKLDELESSVNMLKSKVSKP